MAFWMPIASASMATTTWPARLCASGSETQVSAVAATMMTHSTAKPIRRSCSFCGPAQQAAADQRAQPLLQLLRPTQQPAADQRAQAEGHDGRDVAEPLRPATPSLRSSIRVPACHHRGVQASGRGRAPL
jgi:hypothetical protein